VGAVLVSTALKWKSMVWMSYTLVCTQGPIIRLDGHAGAGGIGAHIGQRAQTQRQDLAVGGQGQLGLRLQVAAVGAGQKLFAAVGNPLDRALQGVGAQATAASSG
jgi:hypothetical protein